ncbi:MAG: SDR family NAD(P)-dependent oxidoreductase [Pseudomonadota bacterium]|nr:SDR family NAD(P)-dependent oxidoreductase [Pseudomonadota bacterium]
MQGRTIVATGATSGIGEKAVDALARQGARIVFVARDGARADATLRRLEAIAPGRGHKAHLADLSLMREAARVGAAIAADEPAIDVLINNAGAVFADRRLTAEGLERTFALNHMSYFVVTAHLLDRLTAAPAARIVCTASQAHRGARLDFDDLQGEKRFNGLRAYQRSKLANILFTRELARRLAGTGVTANCLHPGVVASRFADEAGGWAAPIFALVKRFAISPERGADTLLFLAQSAEVAGVSGEYFAKRKLAPTSGPARDPTAAKRLWEISERLSAAV